MPHEVTNASLRNLLKVPGIVNKRSTWYQPGRPDEFVKKIAQTPGSPIFVPVNGTLTIFVKVAPKIRATSVIFQNCLKCTINHWAKFRPICSPWYKHLQQCLHYTFPQGCKIFLGRTYQNLPKRVKFTR
jgi:hypothetical protein